MAVQLLLSGVPDSIWLGIDGQALMRFSDDSAKNGIACIASRSDAGALTGVPYDVNPETDADFRLRVAQDTMLFTEPFAGTVLNGKVWLNAVTTMAVAVAGGYLTLNSANSAAANGVARVQTYGTFQITGEYPLALTLPLQVAAASVGIPNTTWEIGGLIATGTSVPTDGVFLRMNASGDLQLVANFAGAETSTAPIDYSTWLLPNVELTVLLVISADRLDLWINNDLAATLDKPVGRPTFTQSQKLPLCARIYNGAVAPASATQLKIGPMSVSIGGQGNALGYREAQSLAGYNGAQNPPGSAVGQSANMANSAAPAAATLSNTAAGYTTLGGRFLFAAPAGAETDFALFAYQVPALAVGGGNKKLAISGVWIDATNIGAAVATTATLLEWALGIGSTAVSLATPDAAATRAPVRTALGQQSFVVGDAIGKPVERIFVPFANPQPVEPGTFVHVILRVPIGTATASQQIRGTVGFDTVWI